MDKLFSTKEHLKSKIRELEESEKADEVIEEVLRLTEEYDKVVDEIATLCATKNKDTVKEYFGGTKDSLEGFNQVKTWALKKKLAPKNTIDPPSAKRNADGELVTNKEELEKLYLDTYVERLTNNPVKKRS